VSSPLQLARSFPRHQQTQTACIVVKNKPVTPPPFPSQPSIVARHTGHCGSGLPAIAARVRAIPPATLMNKHSPHMTCPQGVSVASLGGHMQIGQLSASGSSASGGGVGRDGLTGVAVEVPVAVVGSGCESGGGLGELRAERAGESRLRSTEASAWVDPVARGSSSSCRTSATLARLFGCNLDVLGPATAALAVLRGRVILRPVAAPSCSPKSASSSASSCLTFARFGCGPVGRPSSSDEVVNGAES